MDLKSNITSAPHKYWFYMYQFPYISVYDGHMEVWISQILKPHYDSSSLTNEKDHHYFLNSADVCW